MSAGHASAGLLVTLLLCTACYGDGSDFTSTYISIRSGNKVIHYTVDVADTDALRRRGLMHRRSMAADHGMLLLYDRPQKASIWMKNTWLPLDILFIDSGGGIAKITEQAVPHSLDSMPSDRAVRAVLELNAGQVRRFGIREGDVIVDF